MEKSMKDMATRLTDMQMLVTKSMQHQMEMSNEMDKQFELTNEGQDKLTRHVGRLDKNVEATGATMAAAGQAGGRHGACRRWRSWGPSSLEQW